MKFKKAFFFTLFVITAFSLVLLSFKMRTDFREEKRSEIFQKRVEQINFFIDDVENDLQEALQVVAIRSLIGAEQKIRSDREYLGNASLEVPEIMKNGTLEGEFVQFVGNSTFEDWADSIKGLAKRFNINMTFNDTYIRIQEVDSWTLNISVSTNITIIDIEETIGYDFTLETSTLLDIGNSNLTDPMYSLQSITNYDNNVGAGPTKGLENRIQRSPHDSLWQNMSGTIIVSNLLDQTENQLYISSAYGPTYFMRLEGKFNCSNPPDTPSVECITAGIESFVDVTDSNEIWNFSTNLATTCAVDSQFFNKSCNIMHSITNVNTNFRLDEFDLMEYNLTKINSS